MAAAQFHASWLDGLQCFEILCGKLVRTKGKTYNSHVKRGACYTQYSAPLCIETLRGFQSYFEQLLGHIKRTRSLTKSTEKGEVVLTIPPHAFTPRTNVRAYYPGGPTVRNVTTFIDMLSSMMNKVIVVIKDLEVDVLDLAVVGTKAGQLQAGAPENVHGTKVLYSQRSNEQIQAVFTDLVIMVSGQSEHVPTLQGLPEAKNDKVLKSNNYLNLLALAIVCDVCDKLRVTIERKCDGEAFEEHDGLASCRVDIADEQDPVFKTRLQFVRAPEFNPRPDILSTMKTAFEIDQCVPPVVGNIFVESAFELPKTYALHLGAATGCVPINISFLSVLFFFIRALGRACRHFLILYVFIFSRPRTCASFSFTVGTFLFCALGRACFFNFVCFCFFASPDVRVVFFYCQ